MAKFVLNQDVVTQVPDVVVDPGLPVGRYRFQLVVVNDRGQSSEPDVIEVEVIEP